MLRRAIWGLLIACFVVLTPGLAQADEAEDLAKEIEALVEARKFDVAATKAKKRLAILKKKRPAGHHDIGEAMTDLGTLYLALDDIVRAGPLLIDGVAILEKGGKDAEKSLAHAVGYLAVLYAKRGQRREAVARYKQAVSAAEKAFGAESKETARAKRVLAPWLRDFKKAQKLLFEAKKTSEKLKDEDGVIQSLIALGKLRKARSKGGEYEAIKEAIDRADKKWGKSSLEYGRLLHTIANLNYRSGVGGFTTTEHRAEIRAKASKQFAAVEKIYLDKLGKHHTDLVNLWTDWAALEQASNNLNEAMQLHLKASNLEEQHLQAVLSSESEAVKLRYLEKLKRHADEIVSMITLRHFAVNRRHNGLNKLGLLAVLRRKGRALDAVANTTAVARARLDPAGRAKFDELVAARADLSASVIRGPGKKNARRYVADVQKKSDRVKALEKAVRSKSVAFRAANAPISVDAVQAALPKDSVLVEIIRVDVRSARSFSRRVESKGERYVAFILRPEGPVRFWHMGRAGSVDNVVAQCRKALKQPKELRRVGDACGRLNSLTIGRMLPMLKGAKNVLIAPDGALNLIPFASLVGSKGPLVEDYTFSYLSSGRDVLRFGKSPAAKRGPVIVADPAFSAKGTASAGKAKSRGTLARAKFPDLPGTRQEAEALGKLLKEPKSFLGEAATEASLKDVAGPAVLHVATHGFFLSNKPKKKRRRRRRRRRKREDRGLELEPDAPPAAKLKWKIQNPLLRSGLALAGANNKRDDAKDDGILTALEATGLDLRGTQLVALSACETGLGEMSSPAQGVFGMRRALVIAGSETQVMSLWKVDDEATRDLMIKYYRKLLEGKGRAEAMREVQLEMYKNKPTMHPYFWAAFIVSGDPGPLTIDLKSDAPPPDPKGPAGTKVTPKGQAPGCACRAAGTPDSPLGAWFGTALFGLAAWRRRRRVAP